MIWSSAEGLLCSNGMKAAYVYIYLVIQLGFFGFLMSLLSLHIYFTMFVSWPLGSEGGSFSYESHHDVVHVIGHIDVIVTLRLEVVLDQSWLILPPYVCYDPGT